MSLIWHKGHQNPRRERLAWVKCECVFFVVVVFFILGLNVLCYQTTTWSGFCERACKLISFFFFLFSGSQRYNGTQNSRKPIPLSMRIDQQISPASSSSSSSGLIADIDINTKRPGRESELEVAVQKLKDMSITETKGKRIEQLYLRMHWFCFSFALWLGQKTLTNQIKIKPTATWSLAFSRAFCSLLLFTLNSYWLLVIFTFVLIGCCDYFGFGCTAANQNAV